MAEDQYGGRGQAGSTWQSEPAKNLTFSIILGCSFLPAANQFRLNMAVSLGVLEATVPLLGEKGVCIKWPNDIYAGGKKLGGLLIENVLSGQRLKNSVIGIGLNVNQDDFPGLPGATSVKKETGNLVPLETYLAALCQSVEARYLQLKGWQLKGGRSNGLKEAYLRHLLGYGQKRLFRLPPVAAEEKRQGEPRESFEGIITGVSPEGKLLLQCGGVLRAFGQKEISFVI